MLNKKIIFMAILLISLLSLSAVSAADEIAGDIVDASDDAAVVESIDDVSNAEPALEESDENVLSNQREGETLSDSGTGTFTELEQYIQSGASEITLDKNYAFDNESDSISHFKFGIGIQQEMTIYGNGHSINGNNAVRIFDASEHNVTFHNITFIGGNSIPVGSRGDGGAIYGSTAKPSEAYDCTFINNTGQNGGAIFGVKAYNCNFIENTAENGGGAIAKGDAYNSNFTKNNAPNGGAIVGTNEYPYIAINCNFNENQAIDGGALYRVEAQYCNFTKNNAENGGALIYCNALNCTFTNNNATNGGAIKGIEGYPRLITTIRNCTFIGNTAKVGGAAYECRAWDSNFTENQAIDYGGALIYCDAINCTFNENTAGIVGGALDIGSATLCNFTKNSAGERGGATNDANADRCTFLQNSAGISGGAMEGLACDAYECTFIFNRAPEDQDVEVLDRCYECNFIVPTFTASDFKTVYNSGDIFPFELSLPDMTFDGENTTIRIFNNDIPVLNDTALTGEGWTVNLPTGVYKIELSIPNSNVVPLTKIISVGQNPTKISASDVTANYNEDKDLVITLTDNEGNPLKDKQITVDLDGEESYTTDANGQVSIAVGKLIPDTYIAKINFKGDSNYTESSTSAKVTVKKITTQISASDVTATYNEDKDLVITLTDKEGNPLSGKEITVDLDGEESYTTDANGQVSIAVGKLVPDTYIAKISFAGDANYIESSATVKVTVEKITTQLTAKAKTFKFEDKTKKYTVTLKDNKGNPLQNKKVTLKVNGKTYTATTNAKGVATFKLTKLTKKGTYSAVITYAGDKYCKKVTKNAKITVKPPVWETIARGSKKHAMVKKIQRALKKNGFYLSYKGRYLKIDGIYHIYTEMAVKQFQKAKNLKVNGKVDYATAKKLKLI